MSEYGRPEYDSNETPRFIHAPAVTVPNNSTTCVRSKSDGPYSRDRSYMFGGIQLMPLVSLLARPTLYCAVPLKWAVAWPRSVTSRLIDFAVPADSICRTTL